MEINWLEVYDQWAEHIHDDILDDADEKYSVDGATSTNVPDDYYIYVAQRWMTRMRYDCE